VTAYCDSEAKLWAEALFARDPSPAAALKVARAAESLKNSVDAHAWYRRAIDCALTQGSDRATVSAFVNYAGFLQRMLEVSKARALLSRGCELPLTVSWKTILCDARAELDAIDAVKVTEFNSAALRAEIALQQELKDAGSGWRKLWSLRSELTDAQLQRAASSVHGTRRRRLLAYAGSRNSNALAPSAVWCLLENFSKPATTENLELMRAFENDADAKVQCSAAAIEEECGSARYAIALREALCRKNEDEFGNLIQTVTRLEGIRGIRRIAEKWLRDAPPDVIARRGIAVADAMEVSGDVSGCRTLLSQLACLSAPQTDATGVWARWRRLEVEFGSEESFEAMERSRRSLATAVE
jgi:hypothetical protein